MATRKISVCDITLQECVKARQNHLSFKEKLEIAKKINDLGVDVIELGKVLDLKTDPVLFRTISNCAKNKVISVTADANKQSIEQAFETLSAADKKKVTISLPTSTQLIEYSCHQKPAKVLEQAKSALEFAKTLNCDLELSLEDATRTDLDFLLEALNVAVSFGIQNVTLVDLAGNMMPDEFGCFVKSLFEKVDLSKVKLFVQCSDSLGMALANTLAGINAGANGVKLSSVSGDVPSVSAFVKAITAMGDKYEVTCGLNFTGISRLINQIYDITAERHVGRAFVTNNANQEEVVPSDVSTDELFSIIKSLGYDLTAEDNMKVYEEFSRVAEKKSLTQKELEIIIANVSLQVPPTYKLKEYVINSGNAIASTASIKLLKNDVELFGLSSGDGPIDASFLALEKIIGYHFELDDFQIRSITEGRDAVGEALVKLRYNGKIYSGRRISTDIIGASIRAYISALNKIVYEETTL